MPKGNIAHADVFLFVSFRPLSIKKGEYYTQKNVFGFLKKRNNIFKYGYAAFPKT